MGARARAIDGPCAEARDDDGGGVDGGEDQGEWYHSRGKEGSEARVGLGGAEEDAGERCVLEKFGVRSERRKGWWFRRSVGDSVCATARSHW
jgi:hypothetical protein